MKQTQLATDILMQMHVNALYVNDEQQRLVSINDGSGRAAPRFFLGRTAQGAIWRFRHDVPEAICRALTELCEQEPVTTAERPFYETAYSPVTAVCRSRARCA